MSRDLAALSATVIASQKLLLVFVSCSLISVFDADVLGFVTITISPLRKALAAVLAGERPITSVRADVVLHVAYFGKRHAACKAHEHLVRTIGGRVLREDFHVTFLPFMCVKFNRFFHFPSTLPPLHQLSISYAYQISLSLLMQKLVE